MLPSPILGQTYTARSTNAAASRMVNLYVEAVDEGMTAGWLQRTPGLRLLQTVGEGPIRGEWTFSDRGSFYVVSGYELYRLTTTTGTPTLIGTVTGTGPVSMADNGTQLFIACNPDGFIYNQNTGVFGQITDPDFPGAVTVAYLDTYFVFNEPDSQQLWVTQILDGTSIDPFDFTSTDGSPDGLTCIIADHREIIAIGPKSFEFWYNAGNPDFPLARIQGAFIEVGIVSPYAIAKADNSIFWLSQDDRGNGMIFRSNGYTPERVSTHAIEWHIQQYATLEDARFYSYQQDGHTFVVCIFPTGDATWVYDCATKAWHQRGAWNGVNFVRHRSECQCNFNGTTVVGDFENGNIYALDAEQYSDNGEILRWLRAWRALPPGTNDLKRQTHHSLELSCEMGVGLTGFEWDYDEAPLYDRYDDPIKDRYDSYILTPPRSITVADYLTDRADAAVYDRFDELIGVYRIEPTPPDINPVTIRSSWANPRVGLRWSDDGGHTWSNEHTANLGRVGDTRNGCIWRRLGMSLKLRDRVYEVSGGDPVKIAITGAQLDVTPTNA